MEFNKEKFSHFVMERPYLGEIKEANEEETFYKSALDKAGCGDSYELTVKFNIYQEIIEAKYITFGCGFAQATCCALIESILGKKLKEVANWSTKDLEEKIENIMGEYPIHKKGYMVFAKDLLDGICQQALN